MKKAHIETWFEVYVKNDAGTWSAVMDVPAGPPSKFSADTVGKMVDDLVADGHEVQVYHVAVMRTVVKFGDRG